VHQVGFYYVDISRCRSTKQNFCMTLTGPCSVPNQRAPDHGMKNVVPKWQLCQFSVSEQRKHDIKNNIVRGRNGQLGQR